MQFNGDECQPFSINKTIFGFLKHQLIIIVKHFIDLENWERKDHFDFFSKFSDPFWGLTFNVDCSIAYKRAKALNYSFYLYYLYQSLRAVNLVDAFKFRIEDDKPVRYDRIDASATVDKPDGTFGFSNIIYKADFIEFQQLARAEIARVRVEKGLNTGVAGQNVIHYSAVPWISFTSLSHASHSAFKDSIPKISFGKTFLQDDHLLMPVALHAHHALIDGLQAGQFVDLFQKFLNETEI